jgi:toxin ParE1/3/4
MPKKRAEYRLTPEAVRDLEGIWLYTLGEWGIDRANSYTDDLTAAFNQLAIAPQVATACDYIRKGYRRSPVGRHVIYFRITDYGIAVIRVLHDRMDAPRHLKI